MYNILLNYLYSIFSADSEVHTLTTDGYIDMDNYRKNIYPIVDISVVNSPFVVETTALNRFTVDITCVDIRDINKEEVNDKFWLNDNRHDNWNTTHAILTRGINAILKDTSSDITVETITDLDRIVLGKENGLDGWTTTLTIDVPDLLSSSC